MDAARRLRRRGRRHRRWWRRRSAGRLAVRLGAIAVPDDRRVHATPTPTLGGLGHARRLRWPGWLVAWRLGGVRRGLRRAHRAARRGASPPGRRTLVGAIDDVREVLGAGEDRRHGARRQRLEPRRRHHPALPRARRSGSSRSRRTGRAGHGPLGGRHVPSHQPHRRPRRPRRRHRRHRRRRPVPVRRQAGRPVGWPSSRPTTSPRSSRWPPSAPASGSCPYNFNPASIFMGDGGALLLGLLMAASSIAVGGTRPPTPRARRSSSSPRCSSRS